MLAKDATLAHSPLGKTTHYPTHYQPDLLFAIKRTDNRQKLGIAAVKDLPFNGADIWNAYELSWLNAKGKPQIAYAQFIFPCGTPQLIESKSFKLYLNSFNNTKIISIDEVKDRLAGDLSHASGGAIQVKLMPQAIANCQQFAGICLDELDIDCDAYTPRADYLTTSKGVVNETVFSDLLKSNCPITSQPDWASIQISYTGNKINHANLLKYIVSLRNHDEFHEHCVERIFMDLKERCAPEKLCVYARYTRRGGLDINPYRANYPIAIENIRLWRQ